MKNRILVSVLVVTTTLVLVGGATFALFTDSASNTGNSFETGTVVITAERNLGEAIPGPMFYTTALQGAPPATGGLYPTGEYYPGQSFARYLNVKNEGTLNVYLYQVGATVTDATPGDGVDDTVLAGGLNVRIEQALSGTLLYDGTLAALTAGPVNTVNLLPIAVGGTQNLKYTVSMPIDAGDVYQGKSIIVEFVVYARQQANI
ncbi:MAG TPA: hypothetical protein ENN38_01035 [Actinobacteria bacterium]|nr:hypothetical protein [Actinomycetota bacterium]